MKTGMLAGEAAAEALIAAGEEYTPTEIVKYEMDVKSSWVWDELWQVRNFKPAWKFGMWLGLAGGATSLAITRGREPWTARWTKRDTEYTKPAADCKEIQYPKAD